MNDTMNGRRVQCGVLGLHAQTMLHPGSGTALGTVDLPVQRERHTHWPTISGSALKGVLRDACRIRIAEREDLDRLPRTDDTDDRPAEREGSPRRRADATLKLNELFGPPTASSSEFAGAVSLTDARLVAFPVRSLKGVFAWVTCPSVLERLRRDLAMAGLTVGWEVPEVSETNRALVTNNSPCRISENPDRVVLEEFDFEIESTPCDKLAGWLAKHFLPSGKDYGPTRSRFERQLIVLHDDDFTHFARHATVVLARVGLDYESKTVRDGALFYQEFLPEEVLFYSVVMANASRSRNACEPAAMMNRLRELLEPGDERLTVLQLGGDETTGKGFCAARLWTGKDDG